MLNRKLWDEFPYTREDLIEWQQGADPALDPDLRINRREMEVLANYYCQCLVLDHVLTNYMDPSDTIEDMMWADAFADRINAIAICLTPEAFGVIYDKVRHGIKAKLVPLVAYRAELDKECPCPSQNERPSNFEPVIEELELLAKHWSREEISTQYTMWLMDEDSLSDLHDLAYKRSRLADLARCLTDARMVELYTKVEKDYLSRQEPGLALLYKSGGTPARNEAGLAIFPDPEP